MWSRRAPSARDEHGGAAIGFGLVLPMLLALTVGVLELALVITDYHRAGTAASRVARLAAIADAVTDVRGLADGATVSCVFSAGATSCTSGTADSSAFAALLAEARTVMPDLAAGNLRVDYTNIGLGDPATPGGIKPLVTARLVNLRHDFRFLRVIKPLTDGIDYPDFASRQVAKGQGAAP
ncbi:MAG: hypothetical protein COW30_09300 [Rhodospirillales bacterium CG15_BIG_FIL_POST_REV_8_21_14_020_66_15]|nr:MAG: hypothetical protein COW30_09300 [Rhodospirillales bacterium CG15_BIG_FIL_POST_REV_8_21_14_020_66_15]